METSFKNPLRKIIVLSAWTFAILLIIYIPVKYVQVTALNDVQIDLANKIEIITVLVWDFLRPILQLTLLLIIVDWILHRFGFDLNVDVKKFDFNIQVIIAIVIIGSFALAALADLSKGLEYLKDLALVVVGFYFGSQKRRVEISSKPGETKTVTTEIHENPTGDQPKT